MFVIERFQLEPEFVSSLKEKPVPWGFGLFSSVVYYRTYSRMKEDGTQEQWGDTIVRVVEGVMSIRKDWYIKHGLRWNETKWQKLAQNLASFIYDMKILPPGRGLWAMGTEYIYERGSMALNNCGYVNVQEDIADSAGWAMNALMCGVGVGFSTENADLGTMYKPDESVKITYSIPDSREGWVQSVKELIDSYKIAGNPTIMFDYSLLRPEGAPLKGFGGVSGGPAPLVKLHDRLRDYLGSYSNGHPNQTRLIADVMNSIGACVVSGNIRRSAEICMGSVSDKTFLNLKNYDSNPERAEIGWMSNNSVILRDSSEFELLPSIANRIKDNGEPGIANLINVQKYGRVGKKKHDAAIGFNPCFTGDTLVAVADGRVAISLKELSEVGTDVPVYCWGDNDLKIRWGRHPRMTRENAEIWKTTFDDGSTIRTTPDHNFLLRDGSKVPLRELKVGDSLMPFNKHQYTNSNTLYYEVDNNNGKAIREHNLLWEFWTGEAVVSGHNVHHKDKNGLNNSLDNLVRLTKSEHSIIHGKEMIGANNPMYGKHHAETTKAIISQLATERMTNKAYRENISKMLKSHYAEFGTERLQERRKAREIRTCPNCQVDFETIFDSNRKFCSIHCAAIYINSHVDRSVKEDSLIRTAGYQKIYSNTLEGREAKRRAATASHEARRRNKELALTNHKIVSIEPDGYEDVYNLTVDDFHTVALITNMDARTSKGKNIKHSGIITAQCAEIPLEDKELCNLVEIFPARCSNDDELWEAMELATFYASTVSLLPTQDPDTNAVVTRNRRIGVSVSGVADWLDSTSLSRVTMILREGYEKHVEPTNIKLAKEAGVPPSVRLTTVKPSGTISLLAGASPGMHWPVSRYAIRRMRMNHNSPLVSILKAANVPYEKDTYSDNTLCFSFPIEAGNGKTRAVNEVSIWEQASMVAMLQREWADNAVSNTLTFNKSEEKQVERVLATFAPVIKSLSMLPNQEESDHAYAQLPYESINKSKYQGMLEELKPINWSSLTGVDGQDEQFCSNDKCEIV